MTLAAPHGSGRDAASASVLHRHTAVIAGLAATVVVIALAWMASLPTGADSPAGTIGAGSRLAASAPVGDVEVLVVARSSALSVHVAYRGPKGWLSVRLPAVPTTALAAWAATDGVEDIPALSVVYGRAPGSSVVISWADGEEVTVHPGTDSVYVAVRDRRVASEHVRVLGPDGATVVEVHGP